MSIKLRLIRIFLMYYSPPFFFYLAWFLSPSCAKKMKIPLKKEYIQIKKHDYEVKQTNFIDEHSGIQHQLHLELMAHFIQVFNFFTSPRATKLLLCEFSYRNIVIMISQSHMKSKEFCADYVMVKWLTLLRNSLKWKTQHCVLHCG